MPSFKLPVDGENVPWLDLTRRNSPRRRPLQWGHVEAKAATAAMCAQTGTHKHTLYWVIHARWCHRRSAGDTQGSPRGPAFELWTPWPLTSAYLPCPIDTHFWIFPPNRNRQSFAFDVSGELKSLEMIIWVQISETLLSWGGDVFSTCWVQQPTVLPHIKQLNVFDYWAYGGDDGKRDKRGSFSASLPSYLIFSSASFPSLRHPSIRLTSSARAAKSSTEQETQGKRESVRYRATVHFRPSWLGFIREET